MQNSLSKIFEWLQNSRSEIFKWNVIWVLLFVTGLSLWGVFERLNVVAEEIDFEPAAQSKVPLQLFRVAPKGKFLFTLLDNNQLEILVKANKNNPAPIFAIVSMDTQKPFLSISSDTNTSCQIDRLAPGATARCYFHFVPKTNDSIDYSLHLFLNGGKTYDTVEEKIEIFPIPAESILKTLGSGLTALLALLGGNTVKQIASYLNEKFLSLFRRPNQTSAPQESEG